MARRYRRRYYKKPQYTTSGSIGHLAKQAYRGVKFLKQIVNAEKKFFDTDLSSTMTNTGTVVALNDIVAGDDAHNRNGNSIKLHHLYIRANVEQVSAANNYCRIILVQDTANQGTAPAVLDVLTSEDTYSMTNLDNVKRFRILMDKVFNFNTLGNLTHHFTCYKRLGFHIRFDGTGAGTYLQNSLFLIYLDENSTNHVNIRGDVRLVFYDN